MSYTALNILNIVKESHVLHNCVNNIVKVKVNLIKFSRQYKFKQLIKKNIATIPF